jgi:hypothetical protein
LIQRIRRYGCGLAEAPEPTIPISRGANRAHRDDTRALSGTLDSAWLRGRFSRHEWNWPQGAKWSAFKHLPPLPNQA